MDSFEHLISSILECQGFWTRTGLKVSLTPQDRADIGRLSSPRWELDVVGYKARDNRIMVLECKSYLDSHGVQARTFAGQDPKGEKRYKLFFEDSTRKVVLARLQQQLVEAGLCMPEPRVSFGLAAGKIRGDEPWLRDYFHERDWVLWTPAYIRDELRTLADSKYENSIAHVVAKVLLSNGAPGNREADEDEDE